MTAAARPARLAVGVVGVGRVGSVLAAALGGAGHRVLACTGGERAEALLPGAAVLPADEVAARCDLLLLTVPDDALAELVAGLSSLGAIRPGQLVLHASGRHGLGVLDPAAARGALPLALHPVMTFTGTSLDLTRLRGASFGVTTPGPLRPVGEALAIEMGGEPVWVEDADRPLWHAALAHGANHLVTLVAQAAELLSAAGAEQPARVLAPILSAALDGALRHGDGALTGPVVRADAATVQAHLDALGDRPAAASYRALARATADRLLAQGRLPVERSGPLLAVLAEERG